MRFSVAALSLARYPFSVCIYSARGQCFIVSSFSTTASKSPKAHRRRLRHCRMSSLDIWDKQRPYSDENPYQAMSRISRICAGPVTGRGLLRTNTFCIAPAAIAS